MTRTCFLQLSLIVFSCVASTAASAAPPQLPQCTDQGFSFHVRYSAPQFSNNEFVGNKLIAQEVHRIICSDVAFHDMVIGHPGKDLSMPVTVEIIMKKGALILHFMKHEFNTLPAVIPFLEVLESKHIVNCQVEVIISHKNEPVCTNTFEMKY